MLMSSVASAVNRIYLQNSYTASFGQGAIQAP